MNTVDLERQAANIHSYLLKKVGHNWRLTTWKKKYITRLRTYSFEQCIIAIDGFCDQKWWMDHKSQSAPDCIFRSDRSFETFLAAGMKLPKHDQAIQDRKQEQSERESQLAVIRAQLERENSTRTVRMHQKLLPLKDELNDSSWELFIKPLLFVTYLDGTVLMFHENAAWVQNHYAHRMAEVLEIPVKVVDHV